MLRIRLAALLVLLLPRVCLADPFLEKVWPPVVQRGRVNRVQLTGTQIEGALGLWTSTPRTAIAATPANPGNGTSVTLDVNVPADAPLGLYGLRLATKSGLSNVHLFLIDELPVTLRPAEANDAVPATLPACIAAPVRKATIDRYAIDVQAGQRVTFEVIGNRLGKDFDPLVTIRDPNGRMVAEGDNDAGLFFDCRFEVTFPAAGRYTVEVSDARYGGDATWSYVLRMGDFPVARTAVLRSLQSGAGNLVFLPQMPAQIPPAIAPAVDASGFYWQELQFEKKPSTWIPLEASTRENLAETEPNDSPDEPTDVYLPAALNGVIGKPGDEDWYRFEMLKGQSLRVRAQTSRIGSAADLEIVLWEPTNDMSVRREVIRNDETNVRDNERNTTFYDEANFAFNARVDGYHWLQVRDLSGAGSPAHTYRIDVGPNTPELILKSEVDGLSVPKQSYQPVPLKVTRTGFTGPIELSLVGAPPGVSIEPAVIPEKDNEIVCRLMVSDAAAEGLATLQIVGRAKIENKDNKEQPITTIEAFAATHPLIDRQLRNKDRIIYALRADQRELPPSLVNRIALQVTPPSPYDFELPDQELLLPKYQTADFRIITKRQAGFESPLRFGLDGGQIGDEAEERVQIYARVPDITAAALESTGRLHNRILTQFQKHRVDVKATARAGDRDVSLTRTFTLDVKPAFDPTFEKTENELLPGESVKVVVKANRVATYDGPILLTSTQSQPALQYPETIEIPAGKTEVELEVKTRPNTSASRYQLRYEATAQVGGYQETRNPVFHVTVKMPPAPAKK